MNALAPRRPRRDKAPRPPSRRVALTFDELVDCVAIRERVTSKDTKRILRRLVALITRETQRGGKILIPRLGTFERRSHKPRRIAVPNGTEMWLPRTETLKFHATKHQKRKGT